MPISIMEDPNWKCPHCRRVCNTGACRRDPRQHPYEPKGTLLGHDTKKVADPRSVECLVDFSVSNLNWLREEEGIAQTPMQRRMQQAEMDKLADPSLDARFIEEENGLTRYGITYSPVEDANGNINESGDGVLAGPFNNEANSGSYYPGPDIDREIPRLGQKRGLDDEDDDDGNHSRRKKKQKKKKKDAATQPLQPKNVSGQQYQKEVERKLLEEAKREDRAILVAARMKGKSKIVTLSLSTGHLQMLRDRQTSERPQVMPQRTPEEADMLGNMRSILQSDVLSKPNADKSIAGKDKDAKTYRVRVEDDGAYSTRKRNPDLGGPVRPGRPRGHFEEITLDSDEEFADENDDNDIEYTCRSRGRASNWLARRNEGEEDLPTELPADFRDGDVRPNREKDRERKRQYNERRKAMPPKPKARIRPVSRPAKEPGYNSTGGMSDEDGIHEEDDHNSESNPIARYAAAAALEAQQKAEAKAKAEEKRAAAVAHEVEENLRTKMAFVTESDEERLDINKVLGNLFDGDSVMGEEFSDDQGPPIASAGPPQVSNSLLNRPGMAGKSIKIVGSTSKTSPGGRFTSVNKKAVLQDISESESELDVLATAPIRKRPGRPPGGGRGHVVPTRGRDTPKRGRGRPRKTT